MREITKNRLLAGLIFVSGILAVFAGIDGYMRLPYLTPFTAFLLFVIFFLSFTLIGVGAVCIIEPTILSNSSKREEVPT